MSAAVFISYASQDHTIARTICEALENRGLACWIASRDIGPGENFQVSIVRAIRNAKAMVLVFSGNASNSEEIKKELVLAGQSRLVVVPVRVEDVKPDEAFAYEFATRQWVDAFEDWEHSMQRLVHQLSSIPGVTAASDTAKPEPPPITTVAAAATVPTTPAARSTKWTLVGTAGVLVVAAGAAAWLWLGHAGPRMHHPPVAAAPSPPASATASSSSSTNAVRANQAPADVPVSDPGRAREAIIRETERKIESIQQSIREPSVSEMTPPVAPPKPAAGAAPTLVSPIAIPPSSSSPSPQMPEPGAASSAATAPAEAGNEFADEEPGASGAKAIAPEAIRRAREAAKRRDFAEAVRAAREAADKGNPIGDRMLGFIYLRGLGVPRDQPQALRRFRVAADQGDAIAENNVGLFHQNGWSVPRDYTEAMRWFQKAADQGNLFAETNIGRLHENGWGVPMDHAEAMRWFRKAADKGNPVAEFQIGLLYVYGHGVPRDPEQARGWIQRAAAGGNENARRWLTEH